MTLQAKLRRLGEALAAEVENTFHYWRPDMPAPFCVWAEDGEESAVYADDHKTEQAIGGYVDYYTREEYDPVADTIQEILNGITEFPFWWRLESVQYEDETNLIHFQWTWGAG